MNIYDTKTIRCIECSKPIGEIDYDTNVIRSICGQCDDPRPDVKDLTWTDTNDVPEDLVLILQEIEEIIEMSY